MNTLKMVLINLLCLFFFLGGSANAANLLYEISGNLTGYFQPVSCDPFADLLNVPRNSQSSLPFKLQFVMDTNNIPYVVHDTSVLKEAIYRDAIISVDLDLNGTKFQTLRRPIQSASATPPASNTPFDESRINIINFIAPTVDDFFMLILGKNPQIQNNLFNSYTVPFNQTINGIFYENSIVRMQRIYFRMYPPGDVLNGTTLPVDENGFNPLPKTIEIRLFTDLNVMLQLVTFDPNNITFKISEVAPSTQKSSFWLFLPAILAATQQASQ